MKWLIAVVGALVAPPAAAHQLPPIYDSTSLNIGMNCQWQQRCIAKQKKAMKKALSYVAKKRPTTWRIQQCNRNAARTRYRVDWVGFNNCIRNAELRYTPPPPRAVPKKKRSNRITQADRSPQRPAAQAYRGERGF